MINLDWVSDITGWFSPEERMKQKRVKRDELKEQRAKLMKQKCTVQNVKKVQAIDAQLEKIERDLGN